MMGLGKRAGRWNDFIHKGGRTESAKSAKSTESPKFAYFPFEIVASEKCGDLEACHLS